MNPAAQQVTPDINILLIEDNDGDAMLVEEALADVGGFNFSHAPSMEAAQREYASKPFNVMLLDLNLPGLSGFDALEKVRQDQPHMPVIVMTGMNDEKKAAAAMQRGVQDYLVKGSYGNEVLPRAIRYAIERKRFENKVIELANFDRTTGLINRATFMERLKGAIALARESSVALAVLLVDLKHFRDINDTLGHEGGDRLLKAIAVRLKECAGEADMLARLDSDEFVLLAEGAGAMPENLPKLAARIIRKMSEPLEIDGHLLHPGCSIGIAAYPSCGEEETSLVRNADIAMHRAQQNGKNQFQFYTRALNEELSERIMLEKGLREALKNGSLIPYYQPIIDLKTNRPCGVEALLRWNHPEKGFIPPSTFIPIAESSDIILQISEYITEVACRDYALWKNFVTQPFYVAINLSTKDLRKKSFPEYLSKVLRESNISGKHIALEITEGTLMSDSQQTIRALKQCREFGASIFVDDFGTGYSSLSYLSILPLNVLKIDRSFVTDIMTNPQNLLIATAIINLAHGLGLKVVAEGIETKEQKDLLTILKCDKAQGYYFAKPMPVESLTQWLTDYSGS